MTSADGGAPPRTTLGPTPLKDAAFREAVGAVDWEVDARYAWDTGVAVGAYLRGLKRGVIPAVIEIDGASRGIGFMHKLGEVAPDDVAVGMAVEAVWAPEEERRGSILDIRYFRPRDVALRRS
jgi:hypothetical protein